MRELTIALLLWSKFLQEIRVLTLKAVKGGTQWVESLETIIRTTFLRHVYTRRLITIKIDVRRSWCIITKGE